MWRKFIVTFSRIRDDNETLITKDKLINNWYIELSKLIKSNLTRIESKEQKEYVSKSLIDVVKNGYKLLG